ncbi:c-type cytochrome [Daejeonella sp.]|uniref:c-type cytochrome n=1 Tax=Daejeonella sp. TaxID=2805397 RepID=UPI0030BC2060
MNHKIKSGIKYFVLLLVAAIIGVLSYVSFALPDVGEPEDIKVEITPKRLERGSYLANSVANCTDCHSERDWNKFTGPLVKSSLGKGGHEFNQESGFPGKFYAKNITPFALKDWTDGEILRAVTAGVNKDGKALFPIMPHPNFGKLDREDIYSIIAYLRTLTPIENVVPESEPDFPMNFIINTIPQKPSFTKIPDPANQVAYGAYLFTAASCGECHTKKVKGTPVAGMELAGGFEFPMPHGGTARSANITPDMETGIGSWSEEAFLQRFKVYSDSAYKPVDVKHGEFNTMMPWTSFSTMKTDDLKAIYAYLRTVKPIKNQVTKFSK